MVPRRAALCTPPRTGAQLAVHCATEYQLPRRRVRRLPGMLGLMQRQSSARPSTSTIKAS